MVVRIRDSDFMSLGLEWAEFMRWKNHKHETNLEHFKGWYGASPKSCERIWFDLQTTIEEEFRINSDANPLHLLLTLHFLKSYQTELILAPTFFMTEKTARKWIGVYMGKMQLLKVNKVKDSRPIVVIQIDTCYWHKSEANELLKKDIDADKHLLMKPALLHRTRKEYEEFTLEVFRKRIYQEVDSRSKRAYRFEKKNKKKSQAIQGIEREAKASIHNQHHG
jgi:hypothetical protein